MNTAAAGQYFDSKPFIWGLCGGYLFALIGMIFDNSTLMWGAVISIAISFIWWFFEFVDIMNKLSGVKTTDAVVYRNGLKPIVQKFHIKFIEPLDLDSENIDMSKIDDFSIEQSDELERIKIIITKKIELHKETKKLTDEEKKIRMSELIAEELKSSAPEKNLYGYRCELENSFGFPENQNKQKYTQIVMVTKRSFGKEFFFHQDRIQWKNQLVNTSLCYVSYVLWGIAAADTPILYSKFTDVDAYKETKKVITAQTISNVNSRTTSSLFFSLKAKYQAIDQVIEKKDRRIKELKLENQDLQQLYKMSSAKKLQGKKTDLKGKLLISKGLFITMWILIFIGVGILMFIIGKQAPLQQSFPTNSTIGI
jgi:hypothetical protein